MGTMMNMDGSRRKVIPDIARHVFFRGVRRDATTSLQYAEDMADFFFIYGEGTSMLCFLGLLSSIRQNELLQC